MRALIVLFLLGIVASILSPVFLTPSNLLNVLLEVSVTALLAFGQTYIIILAEIDLSVGSVLGLAGAITAGILAHGNIIEALIVGLLVGAVSGLINGLLTTFGKIPSFITTLGTMTAFSGVTLVYTQGNTISISSNGYAWIGQGYLLGVPIPVWIMILFYVIFWLLLSRTHYGRYVFATGGNEEASRLSGISVRWIKILAFVLTGVLAAVAGFISTARLNTAEPTLGSGLELDAIAAVILGGTSLAGGKGGLFGTLVGAIILGVLDDGMNLLNVSAFYQGIAKGVIILLAVLLDRNIHSISKLGRYVNFSGIHKSAPVKGMKK
ncbi:ABC transporter permease [Alicyclobacillus acidoterrestris]|uniref:Ribose ABC transporter permease n=1 Tax=Alicyclobacillus acidoterrestris (strain ATCC 49025 / DSM 3922 / CIP 106132 / NCIMB 13137 / GD3B) TaxID=1356854 RepID=A0A9E6ZUK7_ALIAG|nr:ribose ABC transporter permease [Alicyclobacillus acidoterrestris]UNO50765.1 ribose ABC transporter permease [Alicyclobacillus acidoterrestris]